MVTNRAETTVGSPGIHASAGPSAVPAPCASISIVTDPSVGRGRSVVETVEGAVDAGQGRRRRQSRAAGTTRRHQYEPDEARPGAPQCRAPIGAAPSCADRRPLTDTLGGVGGGLHPRS